MYRTESDDVMQGTLRVLNVLTDGLSGGVYTGSHCSLATKDRLWPRPAMSSAEGQISTMWRMLLPWLPLARRGAGSGPD